MNSYQSWVNFGDCFPCSCPWFQIVSLHPCADQYFSRRLGGNALQTSRAFFVLLSPFWYFALGTVAALVSLNPLTSLLNLGSLSGSCFPILVLYPGNSTLGKSYSLPFLPLSEIVLPVAQCLKAFHYCVHIFSFKMGR